MNANRRLLGCLLALALCARPAAGQEALVLSGGGSRGLAHVGVFLGLEELGYDPDMVIGTSMGAVVGALYAAGYAPGEIRSRVLATGWGGLFAATPVVVGPAREVRFPMFGLDLDLGRRRLSRGLLGQWRINRALVQLLFDANARSRGDFDRLARRYRAVAADLKTGGAVVLATGDLARAARASMAVPGFFAPVPWDGRVLVDGGIADNLPTRVARALGATRVIASDVSRPEPEIGSQASFAVIGRALDLMQQNTQRDPVAPDALVLPALPASITGASFPADATPLIDAGLAAARRDLRRSPVRVGGARPLPPPPTGFSSLVLEVPDSALAALARRAFAGVAPGEYRPERVLSAVDRLYSTGLFEGIWPRVLGGDDSTASPLLVVRLDPPPKLSLAAAAGYDDDRGGRAWASLDKYAAVGRRPAVLSAAGSLGGLERWGSLAARVHPLSALSHVWSLGLHLQRRAVRFYPENAVGATPTRRAGGWLALEFPHVLRNWLATASLLAEHVAVADGAAGFAAGPLLRVSALPADPPVVGMPLLLEAERRWGGVTYSRFTASGSRALQFRPVQLAGLLDLRAVSRGAPPDVQPALGDGHAVPGLRWGQQRGRARAIAGLDVAVPVSPGFLRLRLRAGTVVQEPGDWDRSRWTGGALLGGVWQSALGDVELGYGMATRGGGRVELNVGRGF